MSNTLSGKVALITGGTSGIGLATAKRFVAEGAYVFIMGRRQAELAAASATLGPNGTGIYGDASRLQDLDRAYATIREQKGRLDVLFANAGGGSMAPLGAITESQFDQTFDVNVKGVVFTVQKALPLLVSGATVILTASTTSIHPAPGLSVYGASKAAVRNLARTWILDLAGRNIRINVLSPGPTQTPGLIGLVPVEKQQELLATLAGQVPLGRIGDPDEIAKVAVFLASDASSFVNGIELFADGGLAQI